MKCYKLNTVWLCKLTRIIRPKAEGIMVHLEYEPNYVLIGKVQVFGKDQSMEVPVYENITSGEEFFDGVTKGVFNVNDIGKTFVTERIRVPQNYFSREELKTGEITEERILALYKELFYSKIL